MNNMASKKIMINPTFLKVDKERKKTPKQHSPNLVSLESNHVKKKLIGKIKNFQANQQKKNTQQHTQKIFIADIDDVVIPLTFCDFFSLSKHKFSVAFIIPDL